MGRCVPFPNNTNSISFNIAADSTHYLDLSQTELWVKLSLTKNNVAVTDYSKIGLVNNLLHSIFSQVQVYVNNVEVENTNSHYPYRTYLENLLSYGKEAKKTFLQNEFFSKNKQDHLTSLLLQRVKRSMQTLQQTLRKFLQ
jgi:hypothetical protein